MKVRANKSIRNAAVSAIVIIVLLVVAGTAYTWYNGQHASTILPAAAPADTANTDPPLRPVKPSANAKLGASMETITSPVAPGANASATVKTLPGASCGVTVTYNGVAIKDSGLTQKVASDFGIASWTWTVPSSTPVGTWPVSATCSFHKQSAVVQADLVVAKP